MHFECKEHELDFLELIDNLIESTEEFDKKITLIDKKLNFINQLIELEKEYLKTDLQLKAQDDKYHLERRKLFEGSKSRNNVDQCQYLKYSTLLKSIN